MKHHIFTLSVGVLTCALIALSVANATDRALTSDLAQSTAVEVREDNSSQCARLSGMDAGGDVCEQPGELFGNVKGL